MNAQTKREVETAQANPLRYILSSPNPEAHQHDWHRYLPFTLHGTQWIPYYRTYNALWAAIKYSCKEGWWCMKSHFIMDLTNGEIVYEDMKTND